MRQSLPRTPFSTSLSGSARETETRIRSIFSPPKKRPPVLLLAVIFAACLLCGNLVSCQVAEGAGTASDTSRPGTDSSAGQAVQVLSHIVSEWLLDEPFAELTQEEAARLQDLPASELPRQAVEDLYHGATRRDFWQDMLLPVAADEEADVTVYFVFGGMPAGTYWDVGLMLWGGENLRQDGIVLRYGDRTAYFPLCWDINAKFSTNPPLLVDDLDGDGQPEAALSLAWGEGTGCYVESLYIFDLDTMTYTLPDYTDIPLEITCDPDRTTARLASGDQALEVDLSWLDDRFQGAAEAYNQVRFLVQDGRLLCRLALDFTQDTLGYLASADFPVVYADGVYRLAPAVSITDNF